MNNAARRVPRFTACLAALFAVVAVNQWVVQVNPTTTALFMLLVVLAAATRWGLAESIFTSVAAMLSFNFYFLPPVGTFTIADPQNWVALFAFLVTAITASQLSASAKRRADEAMQGRSEVTRLYELSRALLMEESSDSLRHAVLRAGQILRIGEVSFYDTASGKVFGDAGVVVTVEDLANVARSGLAAEKGGIGIIPVRMGTRVIGSLATSGSRLSQAVRDSVASLLAINYERTEALKRAAAAEVAKRNEEFKSSLLDGLAHDLKTPLTAIRTCVTRLISIPPRTEEVRQELLSIIDQESSRLQNTISEAIELARIESKELHLERQLAPVADIVEMALGEVRDENPARFSVDIPAALEVNVDPLLVRRALLQVIENARKYAPPDSPIRIEANKQSGLVQLSVKDRGPGIALDELERIFEKFYRGRKRKEQVDGTGMGLAIARGIIEAHGGSVCAENRPGGGAAIVFSIPVKQ